MVERTRTTAKDEGLKTEAVTVPKARSGWVKWGSRIGKFLLYGGWILVLFVVLGIVIAVSVLTGGS
jgi:hypothetical protein